MTMGDQSDSKICFYSNPWPLLLYLGNANFSRIMVKIQIVPCGEQHGTFRFSWYLHICFSWFTIFFMLTFFTCGNEKNILHRSYVTHQNYVRHKKYVVATKKILWHPKKRLIWLNTFSVAQKSNTCWQIIVFVVYKYILYWLKSVHKCY